MRNTSLAAPCVALVVCLSAPAALAFAGIFDIANKIPTRVVITIGEELPEMPPPRSPMLDTIAGVVEELPHERIVMLRACCAGADAGKPVEHPEKISTLPRFCVVHCEGEASQSRAIEILREPDGAFVARDLNDDKARPVHLASDKFEALAANWSLYQGGFTTTGNMKPGEVIKLPRPQPQSTFTMDKQALGKRFLNGMHTSIAGAVRDPATEDFLLRLPKDYDPKHAAGLVVWVDARPQTELDPKLFAACDTLGFILIGADNTGNGRPTADRYQLALDCVAIADQHFLIDRSRVYLSGLSGGGVISTHLWGCFPDVFRGAVAMAALGSYRDVPAGPGKVWKGNYQRPNDSARLKLLRQNRLAAITGDRDQNQEPIARTVLLMKDDNLPVRLWNVKGLPHTIAPDTVFLEALTWIDENTALAEEKQLKAATEKLEALKADPAPMTPQRREALVQITKDAPWSDAAWQAVELLKIRGSR